MNATALHPAALEGRIVALLASVGIDGGAVAISTCSQGANNRIHRVETADHVFAVKQYFRHAGDPRDRLAAETAFLRYANAASPGTAPQLLASDPEAALALIEFIAGDSVKVGEVGGVEVDAAIEFFRDLNLPARQATARLPAAAEATFSIANQLALIDGRIAQLLLLEPHSDADARALHLARRVSSLWARMAESIRDAAHREALDDGAERCCISPSDFGFHNALVTNDRRLRFIDFEYAGWDDPAKTVGDFFAQLALPVPIEYFDRFVQRCTEVLPEPSAAARRATLLRAAYQVKWCCIALNVFLPVHLARRKFANPDLDEDALKQKQLDKAERLVDQIADHAR